MIIHTLCTWSQRLKIQRCEIRFESATFIEACPLSPAYPSSEMSDSSPESRAPTDAANPNAFLYKFQVRYMNKGFVVVVVQARYMNKQT